MESVVGINETKLDKLVLELNDYTERIQKIFNELDNLQNDVYDCFDYDGLKLLKNEFVILQSNSKVLRSNLESYKNDLLKIKKKYNKMVFEVVKNIGMATSRKNTINEYIEGR